MSETKSSPKASASNKKTPKKKPTAHLREGADPSSKEADGGAASYIFIGFRILPRLPRLHFGHPVGFLLLVRLFIVASHSLPHFTHFHGTFLLEPGVNSSILIVGWFHSYGRCFNSAPLSSHVSLRLLVSVATRPAHAGHPVVFLLLVRLAGEASHPHPHFTHVHATFLLDA